MKKTAILLIAAGMILSACNLPAAAEQTEPDITTAAALTVDAVLNNKTPLASPTVASSTQPAGTTVSTPTFSQPLASFEDVTNCRTGPGTNYERVTQILPAISVKIVGFYPPNYWVVETDKGLCWVSGEFVTPSGSYTTVPTVTAPPTPAGGVPDAPTFTQNGWNYFCRGDGQTEITLNWNDRSDNETGYRVIRNGEKVADLPANSTTYNEIIPLTSGQSVSYQIQAFNSAGEAASNTATMTCP
ncbi:MAG: hypothetical protein DPW18_18805 [Chloroflexi bacterium]|nr:hypothetical protein [Chloroflexota bacterium]MDL1942498.1 hypothetical protein [Chloroflexi bacterium CFX2]